MKNIYITHKGEDYIVVSYQEDGQNKETEITGKAIEIIEVLCQALHKSFPEGYKTEVRLRAENK